jgi:hypothetical protein
MMYAMSNDVSNDAFDRIEQAAREGGARSALDLLVTIAQRDKNYPLLFEARLMQARQKSGLPLIFNDSLDDLPPDKRAPYEGAMKDAARETGSLFLADGDILRAWPYFRAIGDFEPVAAAIEKIEAHDQLDGIIELAFGQGIHPRKGFELILKHHGICRAITFFHQYPDPKTRDQCALILLRSLHSELAENLKRAILEQECEQPSCSNVSELIRGRDWLFGDLNYYVDTAHLTAIIPLALDFADPEALELAIELCDYGAHLSSQFHFASDPPFDDFYNDHAIFLKALAGRDSDGAIAHFRDKIIASPAGAGTTPAQVLVLLLTRLKRYRDAIDVSLDCLAGENQNQLGCPTLPQLCQFAGDYDSLGEIAKRRGDMLNFAAAAIGKTTASL